MQRKNSGSYSIKQQSTLCNSIKNTSPIKNLFSVATQTENVPNFNETLREWNFSLMSIEEIKQNYINTLNSLNHCHNFINKILGKSINTFGDSKFENAFGFRVPEIPNYFDIFELFLERSKASVVDQSYNKTENTIRTRRDIDENGDEQIIFDLQQYLPKNIGDGPVSVRSPRDRTRNNGMEDITTQSVFKNSEYIRDNGPKNFGTKKKPATSPSRLVKSEKDISKKSSRHDMKALSTTFEEIFKSCNVFEIKSKEHLSKRDTPFEFYQSNREKGDSMAVEKYEQGDQRIKQEENIENNFQAFQQEQNIKSRENTPVLAKRTTKDSFNLIEYSLKHLRDSEYDSDSPPLSSKSRTEAINSDKSNMIRDNILFDSQDISLTNKKSLTVLNKAYQSQSPKKVNEMFKKISQANLRSSEKEDNCDVSDGETFIKFIDNDNFSDECGTEYLDKVFVKNCNQNTKDSSIVKMTTSSDSIILTDEEFERKNRNCFIVWSKEKVNSNKEQRNKKFKTTQDGNSVHELTHKPVKSHPLKLTDKDRSHADQKVLQTIGLFTEKGDFRPGVISILEEKERMSFTQNSEKNVQFRRERKFDVQVHYNINSKVKNLEKQASKESMSDQSFIDQQTGSNISLHSSTVTSSSTVSDSDLLSMEPNSIQTVIKKF